MDSTREKRRRMVRRVIAVGLVVLLVVGLVASIAGASPNPANDTYPGTQITEFPFEDQISTEGATVEAGERKPSCVQESAVKSTVWYRWTPTDLMSAVIDTTGSNFDTVVAVYQRFPMPEGPPFDKAPFDQPPFYAEVGCENDSAMTRGSKVAFLAIPGFTYFIQVAGLNGAVGFLDFDLETGVRGEISPVRGGVNADGRDASADVETTGREPYVGAAADTEWDRFDFCVTSRSECI